MVVANGARETCRKKGKMTGCTKYGEYFILKDVHVVPKLNKKLISLTKLTSEGARMSTEDRKLFVKKGKNKLTFDLRNEGGKFLYYLELGNQEVNDIQVEKKNEDSNKVKKMRKLDINVAHGYCHSTDPVLRKSYKNVGIELVGELKTCDACNQMKAKAKGVKKTTEKLPQK